VAAVWSGYTSRAAITQEKESLQAAFRPVIVDVPLGLYMEPSKTNYNPDDLGAIHWRNEPDGVVRLTVPVRNVGPGPAFVYGSWVSAVTADSKAEIDHQVIPPNEIAVISIETRRPTTMRKALEEALKPGGSYAVTLSYLDLSGTRRFQSIIHLATKDNPLRATVEWIDVHRCDKNWKVVVESRVVTGRR